MTSEHTADYTGLENTIGHTFSNKDLLIQALTHRSFSNENSFAEHNERLEFLGDAILQYVSTRALYTLYPDENEGSLSIYRSQIVSTEFLMGVADNLNLRTYIRVSEGQKRDIRRSNLSLIADVVESLIGAVYLDGGLDASESFIQNHILAGVVDFLSTAPLQDPKTELQELVQQKTNTTPVYTVVRQSGPDHDKRFTVAVMIDNDVRAKATGRSKQEAERKAAKKALNLEAK